MPFAYMDGELTQRLSQSEGISVIQARQGLGILLEGFQGVACPNAEKAKKVSCQAMRNPYSLAAGSMAWVF